MIEFEVQATGIPQPRPKARRIGPGIQIYTPKSGPIAAYKAFIARAFKLIVGEAFEPFTGPLRLTIKFSFERPQSRMKDGHHTCKPDLDNLAKGVMDALNEIAWHDDAQVVSLTVEKRWADTYLGGKSGRKLESKSSYIYVRIDPLD